MEPSAAQVELHIRDFAGPGSPSDPRGRLKHYRRQMTRREPPRRGNARAAGTDYRDVHVTGHLLHTQLWLSCVVLPASNSGCRRSDFKKWEFSVPTHIGQPKI